MTDGQEHVRGRPQPRDVVRLARPLVALLRRAVEPLAVVAVAVQQRSWRRPPAGLGFASRKQLSTTPSSPPAGHNEPVAARQPVLPGRWSAWVRRDRELDNAPSESHPRSEVPDGPRDPRRARSREHGVLVRSREEGDERPRVLSDQENVTARATPLNSGASSRGRLTASARRGGGRPFVRVAAKVTPADVKSSRNEKPRQAGLFATCAEEDSNIRFSPTMPSPWSLGCQRSLGSGAASVGLAK
jgi:hypothetical protein